ncbi:unnamed protein product [Paramecium sonneborni]|uniref:Chromo domain-containing protein n=1 Tax=Paramecium sonneborni TaxID=65129 RepID=A0A8S1PBI5_9CILI|nr:unnamed protein product [Paramecium sonneborni]
MYNTKFPIELIKKKVNQNTIAYKFKWSNGTISIEPMSQLTPQMLELVHKYELQQHHYQINKKVKLNYTELPTQLQNQSKSQQDINQTFLFKEQEEPKFITHKAPIKSSQESNTFQSNIISPQEFIPQNQSSITKQYLKKTFIKQPHQPRPNKECVIKSIRKDNADIFLLVTDDYTKWVKFEDLKKDSPITLCDYLLSKVRFK